MISRKSTIRDVSQLAGVSISTVSRVLNNREKAKTIPEEVRRRVLASAEQLSYVPNVNVRRLFTHRSGIIGLVVPSYLKMGMHIFEDGHLRRLISGIEAGIGEGDCRLLLIFNDDRFRERREYMSLIRAQSVDGLIVWGAQPGEECWREPVEAGLPLLFAVTVPIESDRCSYIVNATRAGTLQALDILMSHGHRRILQLCETRNAFLERSMEEAVNEFSRRCPELKIEVQDIHYTGAEIELSRFRGPERPTAVLAYNYSMGAEAYEVLTANGIRVPEEVEILSCYCYQSKKNRISSLVVNDFEIGRSAVRNLLRLIDRPDHCFREEIPPAFFAGETTRNSG